MKLCKHSMTAAFVGMLAITQSAMANKTTDRLYLMGDDPNEFPVAGTAPFSTLDSAFTPPGGAGDEQPLDDFNGTVLWANVGTTGLARPGAGATEYGLEFDGTGAFIQGARLGYPADSAASITSGGPLDYSGIWARGFQLWVYAESPGGTTQNVVMDTDQHGVGITADGNWFMVYGSTYESTTPVTANEWHHVLVVDSNAPGADADAFLYVDGIAVMAATGSYDAGANSPLVLGASTGDPPGTANFFDGVLDDLEMFVMGTTTGNPPIEYGVFNAGEDNDFIADRLTGVDGDVNQDRFFTEADKTDFIAGWMTENLVGGVRAGDMLTIRNGDLNLDGITGIDDLVLMQQALLNAGMGGITAAELAGGVVPEPSTLALVILLFGGLPLLRRHTCG